MKKIIIWDENFEQFLSQTLTQKIPTKFGDGTCDAIYIPSQIKNLIYEKNNL